MSRLLGTSILCTLVCLTTACSSITPSSSLIQRRDKHYLSAKSIPPLRIPPGYSTTAFKNEYPIPHHNYPAGAEKVSIVPPGLYDS